MKPTTLLRLYPRKWRERYGDEFLALTGSHSVELRDSVDILRAACVEWSRTSFVGPTSVAFLASGISEGLGRMLRRAHVPPSEAVGSLSVLLAGIGVAYLMWRSNEWLFERSPTASLRHVQIGLTLAIVAGTIDAWLARAAGPGVTGLLRPIMNPAFFWAWVLFAVRRQPPRPTA